MAKSYVKFEVPKDVSAKALDAVRMAKQNGVVKKGVNEVTKSIERGMAALVVIAEDVEPEEVVMHLPTLCEQKKIPFVYVPTRQDVGNAVGINVPCASVAIEKAGAGEAAMKDVISKITGKSASSSSKQPEAQPKAEPEHKKESPKAPKEKKPKQEKKEEKAEEKKEEAPQQ
ncbi:MAG: 50S ribosomal protein L7Ae [Candidatus Micrarchaeota archaeon]|nr:50S ribosomal protein L7Ae [Candidatus Micrarchaeota archaeon]